VRSLISTVHVFSGSARIWSAILWVTAWFWASCTSYPRIPAAGDLAGEPMITTVDSNLAKYDLENSLDGSRKDPGLDHQIAGIDTVARFTSNIVENDNAVLFGSCLLVHPRTKYVV
jgi:hypothetical protein